MLRTFITSYPQRVFAAFIMFLASFIFLDNFMPKRYQSSALLEIFEPLERRSSQFETNFSFGLNNLVGAGEQSKTKSRISVLFESDIFFKNIMDDEYMREVLIVEVPDYREMTFREKFSFFHQNLFKFSVDPRRDFFKIDFFSKNSDMAYESIGKLIDIMNSLYREIDEGKINDLEEFLDNQLSRSKQDFKQELFTDIFISISSKQALYEVYNGEILRVLDKPVLAEKVSYPSLRYLFILSIFISIIFCVLLFYREIFDQIKKYFFAQNKSN